MHEKTLLCLGVGFVGFIRKVQILNDVTILYALCIEKKHRVLFHQFQRGVIWIHQTSVVIHQITLCEVNSIKSDNNEGYIINRFITKFIPNEPANFGNPRKLAPRNKTESTVYLL